MKKSTVSVSLGRTINLGDYNSIKGEFGLSTDIEVSDEKSVKAEFKRVLSLVVSELNSFTSKVTKQRGE